MEQIFFLFEKWKEYGNKDKIWEPKENLNCNDMIKEF